MKIDLEKFAKAKGLPWDPTGHVDMTKTLQAAINTANWRPTAYLRFHIQPGHPNFKLRQWWEDETGAGEWRGIDTAIEGNEGWDAPPHGASVEDDG